MLIKRVWAGILFVEGKTDEYSFLDTLKGMKRRGGQRGLLRAD